MEVKKRDVQILIEVVDNRNLWVNPANPFRNAHEQKEIRFRLRRDGRLYTSKCVDRTPRRRSKTRPLYVTAPFGPAPQQTLNLSNWQFHIDKKLHRIFIRALKSYIKRINEITAVHYTDLGKWASESTTTVISCSRRQCVRFDVLCVPKLVLVLLQTPL